MSTTRLALGLALPAVHLLLSGRTNSLIAGLDEPSSDLLVLLGQHALAAVLLFFSLAAAVHMLRGHKTLPATSQNFVAKAASERNNKTLLKSPPAAATSATTSETANDTKSPLPSPPWALLGQQQPRPAVAAPIVDQEFP